MPLPRALGVCGEEEGELGFDVARGSPRCVEPGRRKYSQGVGWVNLAASYSKNTRICLFNTMLLSVVIIRRQSDTSSDVNTGRKSSPDVRKTGLVHCTSNNSKQKQIFAPEIKETKTLHQIIFSCTTALHFYLSVFCFCFIFMYRSTDNESRMSFFPTKRAALERTERPLQFAF